MSPAGWVIGTFPIHARITPTLSGKGSKADFPSFFVSRSIFVSYSLDIKPITSFLNGFALSIPTKPLFSHHSYLPPVWAPIKAWSSVTRNCHKFFFSSFVQCRSYLYSLANLEEVGRKSATRDYVTCLISETISYSKSNAVRCIWDRTTFDYCGALVHTYITLNRDRLGSKHLAKQQRNPLLNKKLNGQAHII